MSATQTATVNQIHPVNRDTQTYELQNFGQSGRSLAGDVESSRLEAPPPPEASTVAHQGQAPPKFKLLVAGFSFFCAGVNDGTLGPLIPYFLDTFHIGTGEIAIIYASTFVGWLLAAVTNPLLTANLSLGRLLLLGAALQLLAQCLRPWASLPLFCVTFFIQALGMAYQDAHGNTFVSSVRVAHRWLGFIHAMYALGCFVAPPIATGIASRGVVEGGGGKGEVWKNVYFVVLGFGVINVVCTLVAFRDSIMPSLLGRQKQSSATEGAQATTTTNDPSSSPPAPGTGNRRRGKNAAAMRELLAVLRLRSVWIVSLFFFFYLGACFTAGGWVVEYLTTVRHGDIARVGYVPTGFYGGSFLGRIVLAEPTYRWGERRMLLAYSAVLLALQLVYWLVPNIVANATALGLMGFFWGPFFATGVSVASKVFPRKVQAPALSLVFVVAQAGGAIFPSVTGLIATHASVKVLQPIVLALIVTAGICWWMVPNIPERRE